MTKLFGRMKATLGGEELTDSPVWTTSFPSGGSGEHQSSDSEAKSSHSSTPPAGVDTPPDSPENQDTTKKRSKIRKRLRHLRRVHELQLRDLGGFIYEVHRTGVKTGVSQLDCEELTRAKLGRLDTIADELAELESQLDSGSAVTQLRVPGIGGECPNCGELFGTQSRFCGQCGTSFRHLERRSLSRLSSS